MQAEISADGVPALVPDLACWWLGDEVCYADRGVPGLISVMHFTAQWANPGLGMGWLTMSGLGPIEF